ncbi:MAG: hypothetical protein WC243_01100 [Patescibacteria group bacterium]
MEYRPPVNTDYQRISSIGPQKSGSNAAALVILIMVLIAGAAMAGVQIGKSNVQSDLQDADMKVEEPESEAVEEVKDGSEPSRSLYAPAEVIQPVPDIWNTLAVPKTGSSRAFTVHYPKEWALGNPPLIKLSKGSAYFEIWPGASSVGECLFEDDKETTGTPAGGEEKESSLPETGTRFPSFKEIDKVQLMWRLAMVEKPNSWDNTFILCEKKPGDTYYHKDTSIGYVPFRIPQSDTVTINEVLEILQKIELN